MRGGVHFATLSRKFANVKGRIGAVPGDRKRSFEIFISDYGILAAPRRGRPRFPAAAILSNGARRDVSDPDARSPGCSRKTWNRCAARVDIDSSVSVFGATHKKKEKRSWPALLTFADIVR